jgi:hypothetical protein
MVLYSWCKVLTAFQFLERFVVQHRRRARDVMVADTVVYRGGYVVVVVEAQNRTSGRHDACSC